MSATLLDTMSASIFTSISATMSTTMSATARSSRRFVRSQRRWQNGNPKVLPTYGPTNLPTDGLHLTMHYLLGEASLTFISEFLSCCQFSMFHFKFHNFIPCPVKNLCFFRRRQQHLFDDPTASERFRCLRIYQGSLSSTNTTHNRIKS